MKKDGKGRRIAYSIAAVLLVGVLFLLTYGRLSAAGGMDALLVTQLGRDRSVTDYGYADSYEIAFFGDSILGLDHDQNTIPYLVGERMGVSALNAALGGTSTAWQEHGEGNTSDAISMLSMVESASVEDFGPQQTVRFNYGATDCFPDLIDALSTVDFDYVKIFVLGGGTNDYHLGLPIETGDPYDRYSYNGATRACVELLRAHYPEARIVLLTPTYTWYVERGLTCEEWNPGGGSLEDYVNARLALAEELDAEVIDLYHGVYESHAMEDYAIDTFDGIHPNEAGKALLADRITAYLTDEDGTE